MKKQRTESTCTLYAGRVGGKPTATHNTQHVRTNASHTHTYKLIYGGVSVHTVYFLVEHLLVAHSLGRARDR